MVAWGVFCASSQRQDEASGGASARERRRVVRVFSGAPDGGGESGGMEMTDALGRSYRCGLDEEAAARRAGGGDAGGGGGGGGGGARSAIESYINWRASSHECASLSLKREYWHYEVCPGRSARQFKPATLRPRGGEAAPEASFLLGRFARTQAAEATMDEVARTFGVGVGAASGGGGLAGVLTLPPARADGAARSAVLELYDGGDDGRRAIAYVVCGLVHVGRARSRRASLDYYGDEDDADWADAVRVAKVVEGPEHEYRLLLASPLACTRADLRAAVATQGADRLVGKCLRRRWRSEWWTYEVCLGVGVRQFRAPAGKDHDGFALLDARDAAPPRGDGDDAKREKDAGAAYSLGAFSHAAVSHAGAVSHAFRGGDACEVTDSEPRDATVAFQCVDAFRGRHKKAALAAVSETTTCSYDIVVHLAALCALEDDADLNDKRASGTAAGVDHLSCYRDP